MTEPNTPESYLNYCFASTFGMCEYETLAKSILKFLATDESTTIGYGWDRGTRWKRQFFIREVTTDTNLFAMFAAAGWVQNTYFPKGGFIVTDGFIKRITAETCLSCKGSRKTFEKCTAGNKPGRY